MLPHGHEMSLRLKSPSIQTVALLLPVQSSDNSDGYGGVLIGVRSDIISTEYVNSKNIDLIAVKIQLSKQKPLIFYICDVMILVLQVYTTVIIYVCCHLTCNCLYVCYLTKLIENIRVIYVIFQSYGQIKGLHVTNVINGTMLNVLTCHHKFIMV
jgi:hypothetical protein